MKKQCLAALAALCLISSGMGRAADQIRIRSEATAIRGQIMEMAFDKVGIDRTGTGVVEQIAVNKIASISFDDEPTELGSARKNVADGRYEDALTSLGEIPAVNTLRVVVQQDVQFYTALCRAKIALAGSETISVTDAGKELYTFLMANKGNYHYLEANEVLGDMLVATGKYDQAETYYRVLQSAPWDDYKMRASVLLGRALLAQPEKATEAGRQFQMVLDSTIQGKEADAQRLAARLGKAAFLALTDQADQAVALVQQVIADASPENTSLHAQAYNTLGNAHRKAGRTKEALLAFLHVHVLFHGEAEAHAEALFNLAELWKAVNKQERAVAARQILKSRYGSSPWAQRSGG